MVRDALEEVAKVIWQHVKSSSARSLRVYKRDLGKPNSLIWLAMSIIIFPLLVPAAFSVGWLFGFSYVFAGAMAIWSGAVLTKPNLILLVFTGALVGKVASDLFSVSKDSLFAGDYIGALVLVMLGLYIRSVSGDIEQGNLYTEPIRRRRRRR